MEKVTLERIPVGAMRANCYLLTEKSTGDTFIVDPGGEAKKLMDLVRKKELRPVGILLTHGHFDHIMAAEEIKEEFGIPVMVYEGEDRILKDPQLNLSAMVGQEISMQADITFKDNQVVKLGDIEIQVIHTPGHTCGSVCFYVKREKTLISGDTLFQNSIGRTDFPTGDHATLMNSIRERLIDLPGETRVYPGHEGETTIQKERGYFL